METTNESSTINWMTCTPEELQSWLLQYRFPNEPSAALAFLQQTMALLKHHSSQPVTPESTPDLGVALLKNSDNQLEVSLTTPRVKAAWVCYEHGMRFTDKKGESMVVRHIKHMVVFPKPEDCNKNKNVTDMVLLIPNDPVTYKSKPQTQICFPLPAVTPDCDNDEDSDGLDPTDQWIAVLCRSCHYGVAKVARVLNPAIETTTAFWRYQFQSHQDEATSTTTGGMPFVKCYYGVQDGALYPLLEGLLFFKPPLFIPRSEMESIGCGRDGGRYVDLQVTVAGQQVDFTNIQRAEINELRDYIHQKLIPAMQKDVSESPMKPTVSAESVSVEEDEGASENRPRKRRKASLEAEAVNRQAVGAQLDEDDDDDDEGDMDYDAGVNDAADEENGDEDDDDSEEEEDFEDHEAETETESEDIEED
ncbi:hypothetical protein FisN_24Hh158 [Fistulifera solaris]|uniref:Histone chaperone RTT106/FACT complex subunit SPT16-like middle domain-containing protein n=1 Tax=Fistulifera solaris TaxID=1519565 RepID=A0A1Z5JUQ6_FISSO|nr:hypothetical protein FisN_24Hh158 [Fistulifera solaris]|eukprot:GAX17775.1 hypothetical protein FisN_24Hh158 [Fistulifera solaris]